MSSTNELGKTKKIDLLSAVDWHMLLQWNLSLFWRNAPNHLGSWKDSSVNRTRSTTFKFLLVSFHFFLSWSVGKFPLVNLRQDTLARYYACRQEYPQLLSSLLNTPRLDMATGGVNGRWVGGCSSWGLSVLRVRGLEFRMFTTSAITSSDNTCSLNKARKIWCSDRVIRSHAPPMWLAAGGLKGHSIFFCPQKRLIFCWFHPSIASFSSLSALVEFVPRSLLNHSGQPRILMNLLSAFAIESVSKEWAVSMWIARVVRKIKMHPYLFTRDLPCFTSIGPK